MRNNAHRVKLVAFRGELQKLGLDIPAATIEGIANAVCL